MRWKWLEKQMVQAFKKSLAYKVMVDSMKENVPYEEAHHKEDRLATQHLYTQIPAIYAGVKAIANAIACVPIRVIDKKTGKERPDRHPMYDLINNPNDIDTTYDLMEQTGIFMELTGHMPWLLDGKRADIIQGGPPDNIIPLHPNYVTPIPDKRTKIRGYKFRVNNEPIEFDVKEIVRFRFFDPSDPIGLRGLGSGKVAAEPGSVDRLATEFNKGFFRRGAQLSGVLQTDSEDIEPEIMRKLVEQFRQRHAGAQNAWDIRGLTHGVKYVPTQPTLEDMLFEKMRGQNREEMLMCEGTPPIWVTLMDGATYSNAQQQEYVFMVVTILPKLRKIEARLNKDIAPRYGDNSIFVFDTSDIRALQPDRTKIMEVVTKALERRTMNPDEGRQWLTTGRIPKLDPVPHGKEFLTNFQITLLNLGNQKPPPDQPDTPDVGDESQDPVENMLARLKTLAGGIDKATLRKARIQEEQRIKNAFGQVMGNLVETMLHDQLRAVVAMIGEREDELSMTYKNLDVSDEVGARFKEFEGQIDDILDVIERGYLSAFTGVYGEGVDQVGKLALEALGAGIEYTSGTVSAATFANQEAFGLMKDIHSTTAESLRSTLATGIAEGEANKELIARVQAVLGEEASAARGRRAAITEANKVLNFGTLDAWGQTGGLVKDKGWVSSGDSDVRETHAEVDGTFVGLNENFQVGGFPMAYPGDTSQGAEAQEVVGCRCSMEARLVTEELSDEDDQGRIPQGHRPGGIPDARAASQRTGGREQRAAPVVAGGKQPSSLNGKGR